MGSVIVFLLAAFAVIAVIAVAATSGKTRQRRSGQYQYDSTGASVYSAGYTGPRGGGADCGPGSGGGWGDSGGGGGDCGGGGGGGE